MGVRFEKTRNGGLRAIGSKYSVTLSPSYVKYHMGLGKIFGNVTNPQHLFVHKESCFDCHKKEIVSFGSRRAGPECAELFATCLNCKADYGDVAD